jgi:hypothetical protein
MIMMMMMMMVVMMMMIIIIIIKFRGIYQRAGLTQGPILKPAQRYKTQKSTYTKTKH